MLYHVLLILYLALVLSAAVVIVLENRPPVKTVAWILSLFFLPVLGLAVYLLFGRRRHRWQLISRAGAIQLARRAAYRFYRSSVPDIPEEHYRLIYLFRRQSAAYLYPNNRTDVFMSGGEMFAELLKDIQAARHHVHVESYIIEDDEVGRSLSDALIAKVREGVQVRLIYDDVGCWNVPSSFFRKMREAGVEVRAFLPVRFAKFTPRVNFRNHRKIVVVDGVVGYVGGMNLARRYVTGDAGKPVWRDTHLRLQGNAVQGLQRAFLADWYVAADELVIDSCYFPKEEQGVWCREPEREPEGRKVSLQIVTSLPTSRWSDIMQGMVLALMRAKRYCYIQTPYFLPTERFLFAMQTAAFSGVDVRLMIPEWADRRLLTYASRSYLLDVMRAGVRVYLYQGAFLHAKTWVSDDSLASCGSTNIDFRSFENNFEVNAFLYDKKVALAMKRQFLADAKKCYLLNLDSLASRARWHRKLESFIRVLAPLL
ncbi:MAG: cardiolipin synthase [Paraprevotella sp.]|nr:cardiolipin synthase [Paraprevotella sp.]